MIRNKYLWMLIFLVETLMFGCSGKLNYQTTVDSQLEVNLTIENGKYEEETVFQVGEVILARLQIENNGDSLVQIDNLCFAHYEELAFFGANSVHLISPKGQDLLVPYRYTEPLSDHCLPIQVNAHDDRVLYFRIYQQVYLRESGEYLFWLDLSDDIGTLYQSNLARFYLEPLPTSISPHLVELTIKAEPISADWVEPLGIIATFTNNSGQQITFLKPQNGSFSGWPNPTYELILVDNQGRTHPTISKGPDINTLDFYLPVYDSMSLFTLNSGDSYSLEIPIGVELFSNTQSFEEHTLKLAYFVVGEIPEPIGEGFREHVQRMEDLFTRQKDIFIGFIESNEIVLTEVKGCN